MHSTLTAGDSASFTFTGTGIEYINEKYNDEGNADIYYTGTWFLSSSRGFGDYSDDVHSTLTAGDSASFTFTGTGIEYINEKYNDEGNVDIYIDGVFDQTINCYNAARISQQVVYSKTWSVLGTHTIKIVKNSGTYMTLDSFKVYNIPVTINDTSAAITYAGTWLLSSSRGYGDYNDDVHSSLTAGDSASYTFVGNGVDYINEKNSDEGNVDIYIDGVFDQTINCYNTTRLTQQVVYNKAWTVSGTHTIRIVKNSGLYFTLDAFKVYN